MARNKKLGFMLAHGTAAHLHEIIDSGEIDHTFNPSPRLASNPEYNRSHVEKLLNSGVAARISTAFNAGEHITSADLDRHVDHPDRRVQKAVMDVSWNPDHFSKILQSSYTKDAPSNVTHVLDIAHRRGILNSTHIKHAKQWLKDNPNHEDWISAQISGMSRYVKDKK